MVPDLVSGGMVVPELYSVPEALVTMEEVQPGSQERVAAGRVPFMWATVRTNILNYSKRHFFFEIVLQ